MAEQQSGEFEAALVKLEQIVKALEGNEVGLDKSVELFKQGRELAARCEKLLADAQAAIDKATTGVAAEPERRPAPAPSSSLFDDDLVDDGE
jgi:exodeoxyribonuclease VII small subunit